MKRKITDSISENLTDSDLESIQIFIKKLFGKIYIFRFDKKKTPRAANFSLVENVVFHSE